MDFRSCSVINDNFIVTEGGDVACPRSEQLIENSMERAYVFTNLFFNDITQKEIDKLVKKISDRKESILETSDMDATATEKLFPQLSAMFKTETKSNSMDGLIKTELGKIKPHLSLKLTPEEEQQMRKMKEAIYKIEFEKFRTTTIVMDATPSDKPKKINFSAAYISSLPPRAKRLLAPVIKMVAYMYGFEFASFELSPDFKLTYKWSKNRHTFDEEVIKNKLKAVIAAKPFA